MTCPTHTYSGNIYFRISKKLEINVSWIHTSHTYNRHINTLAHHIHTHTKYQTWLPYLGLPLNAAWCRALKPLLFVTMMSACCSKRIVNMSSLFLLIASCKGVSPSESWSRRNVVMKQARKYIRTTISVNSVRGLIMNQRNEWAKLFQLQWHYFSHIQLLVVPQYVTFLLIRVVLWHSKFLHNGVSFCSSQSNF